MEKQPTDVSPQLVFPAFLQRPIGGGISILQSLLNKALVWDFLTLMFFQLSGCLSIAAVAILAFFKNMGHSFSRDKSESDDADSDQAIECVDGNVHRITSKEDWDQKLSEAKRSGRIDLSMSWDIRATPTFFFLKDGQQIDKLVGANKQELQKKITAVLDSIGNYRKFRFKRPKVHRGVKGP